MKNALPMTLLIIALLSGSMALGKLIMSPDAPISTQSFSKGDSVTEDETLVKGNISAPDFSADMIYPNEGIFTLNHRQGRYTLLNIWASWCTPCVTEMPHLFSLASANPGSLQMVALSIDTKKEKAKQFFSSLIKKFDAVNEQNIYAVWDKRAQISQNLYGTFQVPESYLISPEGTILHKYPGVLDEETLTDIQAIISQ